MDGQRAAADGVVAASGNRMDATSSRGAASGAGPASGGSVGAAEAVACVVNALASGVVAAGGDVAGGAGGPGGPQAASTAERAMNAARGTVTIMLPHAARAVQSSTS